MAEFEHYFCQTCVHVECWTSPAYCACYCHNQQEDDDDDGGCNCSTCKPN